MSETMQTSDEAQNETNDVEVIAGEVFEGSAEEIATVAKVSFNMGKNVTIISDGEITKMHEALENSQAKGREAYVADEEHDPSGNMKRLCVSAFYFTLSGDDKVVVN